MIIDILSAKQQFATERGTVLSVSLVYANKPEFCGGVDGELSTRLGINYKLMGDHKF